MALNEKVDTIRKIVTLVCEILPQVVSLIKEVIIAIREIQTV